MKDCIYTSGQHADTETQAQVKFFDKLTLNAYRKAIANRYGFKSYKLFKEALDKENNLTVYVVSFEILGSSGGWYWFYDKEDALSHFEQQKDEALEIGMQLSYYEVTLSKEDDIDEYLEGYDGEHYDDSELMFPYPKDVWKEIIDIYNESHEIETMSEFSALKLQKMRKNMQRMLTDKRILDNTKDPESRESLDASVDEFIDSYITLVNIDNRIVDNITQQEMKIMKNFEKEFIVNKIKS